MRERLIELLKKARIKETYTTSDGKPVTTIDRCIVDFEEVSILADYLLKNGIIAPPCKAGDKVYEVDTFVNEKCRDCLHFRDHGEGWLLCKKSDGDIKPKSCIAIEEKVATENDILHWLYFEQYNKTIFLTKEQAEQAMAKLV